MRRGIAAIDGHDDRRGPRAPDLLSVPVSIRSIMDSAYLAGLFDSDGSLLTRMRERKGGNRTFSVDAKVDVMTAVCGDKSYYAGLFDGDGTIYSTMRIRRGHSGLQSSLHIPTTSEGAVDSIVEDLLRAGFRPRILRDRRPGQLPSIRIIIHSREEISKFIRWIRPYSRIKAAQIDYWLNEIYPRYGHGGGHFRRSKEDLVELADVLQKFSAMKNYKNAGNVKWTPERVSEWCLRNGIE